MVTVSGPIDDAYRSTISRTITRTDSATIAVAFSGAKRNANIVQSSY